MNEMTKIIIQNSDEKTSEERNLELISSIEKQFNTGPIIGEAREVLYFMAENLMVRDLMLHMAGVTDAKKISMFSIVLTQIKKRDEDILKERNK